MNKQDSNRSSLDECCCLSNFEIQLCQQTRKQVAKEILQDWYNENKAFGNDQDYVLELADKYGIAVEE